MFKTKHVSIIFSFSLSLMFIGCATSHIPESEGGYYHEKIYFGKDLSTNMKKGIVDGCTTAKGHYKKSHTRFNHDKDYYEGWFLGRKKCKNLLKLDEKGDIIS